MNKIRKKIFFVIILVVLSLIFAFSLRKINSGVLEITKSTITLEKTASMLISKFSYNGQKGIDALTLLKEKAKVEQDNSGLVVSINDRKAENSNHEYWAFYVNDKLANVGPASYKTSDSDIITWKIDKY